nr:MAG TPA: hypothetical protein [Caudoviricetes sp.]
MTPALTATPICRRIRRRPNACASCVRTFTVGNRGTARLNRKMST